MLCGPVGMSDGQTELAVTFLYPTMGAGMPLGGVAAARKAVLMSTNEGDLSFKQPVRSFPSGLSFSRMMTTSQGGRVGDVNGSVASELADA